VRIHTTVRAMRAEADLARRAGHRLALVPTMGALHEGHLALVREARRAGTHVTVSIFVNPTQFAPGEDFDRYPHTLEDDIARLHAEGGVDCVFAPTVEEMYPLGADEQVSIHVGALASQLCGPHRPGHFEGVATVVSKLFHVCAPHYAAFGLKDAQQFFVLRRLARAQLMEVELLPIPIQREPDGLALSSRNRFLSMDERAQAPVIYEALLAAEREIARDEDDVRSVEARLAARINRTPLGRVQYAQVVTLPDLTPATDLREGQRLLIAVAAYFGQTRLIDNLIVEVPGD
jgi:pantoate--beta-alanine ligase